MSTHYFLKPRICICTVLTYLHGSNLNRIVMNRGQGEFRWPSYLSPFACSLFHCASLDDQKWRAWMCGNCCVLFIPKKIPQDPDLDWPSACVLSHSAILALCQEVSLKVFFRVYNTLTTIQACALWWIVLETQRRKWRKRIYTIFSPR